VKDPLLVTDPDLMKRLPRTLAYERLVLLLDALRSAQETVRAFDTKAQIGGAGFIISVTALATLLRDLLPGAGGGTAALAILAIAFVVAIALFGHVLWPRAVDAKAVGHAEGAYYVTGRATADAEQLIALQDGCDWKRELAFELIAVSAIRDDKQRRFRRAILGALAFYALFCALAIGGAALPGG
jgi:hypothetical protein